MLWTRSEGRGKTGCGRQLAARRWTRSAARSRGTRSSREISRKIAEVNERICEAGQRPARSRLRAGGRRKKGVSAALATAWPAEVGRLAGEAARALAPGGAGLAAAEAVIREGVLRLGGGILGELLSADAGYRGPRVACGNGHEAAFTGYRGKVINTVVGEAAAAAGLVPLRPVQARPRPRPRAGPEGRRARDHGHLPVARAGRDDRHRRGGCPVRQGRGADKGAGRDRADRQTGRAGRRGGRRRPGPPPPGQRPGSSPGARSSRCPRTRCRTSSTPSSTAPASPVTRKGAEGRHGKGEDGRARTARSRWPSSSPRTR